jgi:hypothetical protein
MLHQVGYLQEMNRDGRSTEHKILLHIKLRDAQQMFNSNYPNFLSHTPKSCLCIKIHREKQLKVLTVISSQSQAVKRNYP